jgi:Holliday junction resolvase RusA-like endonuclease
MSTLRFTILGDPVTKGSVVAFVPKRRDGSFVQRFDGSPMVVKHDDSGMRGKVSAAEIGMVALEARGSMGLVHDEAVAVTLRFFVRRPKGHYGSGRNAGLLKDSAPARPAKRPDVDKMVRHVLDALKGVLYADDGQVVDLLPSKFYAEGDDPPRTEVEVSVLSRQTVGVIMDDAQLALAA